MTRMCVGSAEDWKHRVSDVPVEVRAIHVKGKTYRVQAIVWPPADPQGVSIEPNLTPKDAEEPEDAQIALQGDIGTQQPGEGTSAECHRMHSGPEGREGWASTL